MSRGRIEKALSGFYYVNTGAETLQCRARGKFRREGVSPLVGDRVEVRELGGGEGFVEAIEERRNVFSRPAAANIDQLVLISNSVRFCDKIIGNCLYTASFCLCQTTDPIVYIHLFITHIRAKSNVCSMPFSSDFHRYGFQRKTNRCPRLFNLQSDFFKSGKRAKKHFCKILCKRFQKFISMFSGEICNHVADFPVIDRSRQIVR